MTTLTARRPTAERITARLVRLAARGRLGWLRADEWPTVQGWLRDDPYVAGTSTLRMNPSTLVRRDPSGALLGAMAGTASPSGLLWIEYAIIAPQARHRGIYLELLWGWQRVADRFGCVEVAGAIATDHPEMLAMLAKYPAAVRSRFTYWLVSVPTKESPDG